MGEGRGKGLARVRLQGGSESLADELSRSTTGRGRRPSNSMLCFGLMTCVRPTVDQWSCSGPAQFCTADVDQPRPSAADGHLPKILDPPCKGEVRAG